VASIEDMDELDEFISESVSVTGVVDCRVFFKFSLIAMSAQPKNCSEYKEYIFSMRFFLSFNLFFYTLNNTTANTTDIAKVIMTPTIACHPFPLKHAMVTF
jgi:hypothetical protein